jgi:NitT/TauT family transport system permease protein
MAEEIGVEGARGSQEPKASLKEEGFVDWSALTSISFAGTQMVIIVVLAIAVLAAWEILVRVTHTPTYVLPKPSEIGAALINNFPTLWPHVLVTLKDLFIGYMIGASIGIVLAAVITQIPFVEKIVTPYVLILVCTPMMALVPLLILKLGFGEAPRVIAVCLAVFPMVMINASTGFRRTDAQKLALARLYGASTTQVFAKVRFPLALPMIIVGLMVGGIFGLLTAVGAEMVGGGTGLGNRLQYYSSLARMDSFFSVMVFISTIGIALYVLFYFVGKKWASWEA